MNSKEILAKRRQRYEEKREQILAYSREWYRKNKGKRLEQIREYRTRPKEAENLKQKAEIWRKAHREQINQNKYVQYHLDPERHREYARKYREKNREKVREFSRRSKLKKKGLEVVETMNFRFILPVVKVEDKK